MQKQSLTKKWRRQLCDPLPRPADGEAEGDAEAELPWATGLRERRPELLETLWATCARRFSEGTPLKDFWSSFVHVY